MALLPRLVCCLLQRLSPRKDENSRQPQNLLAMAYESAAADERQHDCEAGDHHLWWISESFHFLEKDESELNEYMPQKTKRVV